MKFRDDLFYKEGRFTLGTVEENNKRYLAIPVTIGIFDYEEYYEISESDYEKYIKDPALAVCFSELCRKRQHDELLLEKPGKNRGVAC